MAQIQSIKALKSRIEMLEMLAGEAAPPANKMQTNTNNTQQVKYCNTKEYKS